MQNVAKVGAKCSKGCCKMQQKMMQNAAKVNAKSSKIKAKYSKS